MKGDTNSCLSNFHGLALLTYCIDSESICCIHFFTEDVLFVTCLSTLDNWLQNKGISINPASLMFRILSRSFPDWTKFLFGENSFLLSIVRVVAGLLGTNLSTESSFQPSKGTFGCLVVASLFLGFPSDQKAGLAGSLGWVIFNINGCGELGQLEEGA